MKYKGRARVGVETRAVSVKLELAMYEEVERLAIKNRRTLSAQIEMLIEEALTNQGWTIADPRVLLGDP